MYILSIEKPRLSNTPPCLATIVIQLAMPFEGLKKALQVLNIQERVFNKYPFSTQALRGLLDAEHEVLIQSITNDKQVDANRPERKATSPTPTPTRYSRETRRPTRSSGRGPWDY